MTRSLELALSLKISTDVDFGSTLKRVCLYLDSLLQPVKSHHSSSMALNDISFDAPDNFDFFDSMDGFGGVASGNNSTLCESMMFFSDGEGSTRTSAVGPSIALEEISLQSAVGRKSFVFIGRAVQFVPESPESETRIVNRTGCCFRA